MNDFKVINALCGVRRYDDQTGVRLSWFRTAYYWVADRLEYVPMIWAKD